MSPNIDNLTPEQLALHERWVAQGFTVALDDPRCATCGGPLPSRRAVVRYCSDACRKRRRR